MASTGYIIAQVSTADQVIPLSGASVMVTKREEGKNDVLIGFRITDSAGKIEPIEVEAPDAALSREPGGKGVFSVYDIRIEHPGYYPLIVRNAQVFGGLTSSQNAELIPRSSDRISSSGEQTVDVEPQNL